MSILDCNFAQRAILLRNADSAFCRAPLDLSRSRKVSAWYRYVRPMVASARCCSCNSLFSVANFRWYPWCLRASSKFPDSHWHSPILRCAMAQPILSPRASLMTSSFSCSEMASSSSPEKLFINLANRTLRLYMQMITEFITRNTVWWLIFQNTLHHSVSFWVLFWNVTFVSAINVYNK